MQEQGLKARCAKVYRRKTGIKGFFGQLPNLLIESSTTAPNQVWVGDVTYLRVAGSWRYLAAVMDLHSRRIVGWRIGASRDIDLTLGALSVALRSRGVPKGLIFHSDRGVEYAAYRYRTRLASLGIGQSMKRPGEITDNAYIESFFHSLKSEATHGVVFHDEEGLKRMITRYIRRYNKSRLHSALGYRSPIDFEQRSA